MIIEDKKINKLAFMNGTNNKKDILLKAILRSRIVMQMIALI